jgi:ribosomal protein L12E/L44/L45/RPP1/RPP2
MAIPDARAQAYIAVFRNQHGSGFPVFQGLDRYQSGQGFGDIFRGILRRVLPVAINVAKSALAAFSGAQEQGQSITESLKATMRPAAQAAMSGALEQFNKAQEEKKAQQAAAAEAKKEETAAPAQTGTGRKRKVVYKRAKKHKKNKFNYNF